MSGQSPLVEWASLEYEAAKAEADNNIDLIDPVNAERFYRDAFRIIRDGLGQEWLDRELDPSKRGGFLLMDGTYPEDATTERHMREDRVTSLALELHEARHIRGFDHLILELRRRQIYEAMAELRAVNHMRLAGEDAWFVDPSERRGHTYDGMVVVNGIEVAVEVKAKMPKPVEEFRPKLIENSLRTARRQLPATGPSLIYLQLASPWTDDPATMGAVELTIRAWLRNTGRVNGVQVMFERTFDRPEGQISVTRGSVLISNPRVRYPVPDLQG